MRRFHPLALLLLASLPGILAAQSTGPSAPPTDPALLTVQRIYGSRDFSSERFGPSRWLPDGRAYTTVEQVEGGRGREIVRYDASSGARTVLVTAAELTPAGDSVPLDLDGYT